MIAGVADTHTVIWYLAADARLSEAARTFIDSAAANGDQIGISAITLVEMVYLIERSRIPAQRFTDLARELAKPDSMFAELVLDLKIARAVTRIRTQEIPEIADRVIAATALQYKVAVISRDRKIALSNLKTIW